MAWVFRSLLLCAAVAIGAACGEPADSNAELTVLVPSGAPGSFPFAAVTSLEYSIACESGETEGELSWVGSFEGGQKGTTAVWKGSLGAPPGACAIRFLARAGDDELVCDWTDVLPDASDWPSELFIELPCYRFNPCTSTPLPGAAYDKTSCYSTVGVLLSVETPEALDRVQRIEYVISEVRDDTFVGETEILEAYRGELSPAGSGEIDLGAGPVPTDRWQAAIEDVPALEYLIELSALDSEGGTVCAVERQVEIIAGAVAQVEVAMPCIDATEGAP